MVKIGSNIAALNAQRHLREATGSLSTTFERLSSGLRINRASDDAAGLAVYTSLKSDARTYTQAIRNINDGMSLLNVADSTLGDLDTIGVRLRELATQAANGTLSRQQRLALNKEADALSDEWNRITASAKFNGLNILGGDLTSGISLQVGARGNSSISFQVGNELARSVGDGSFSDPITTETGGISSANIMGDFNGDGKADIVALNIDDDTLRVQLGNGDGTFSEGDVYTLSGAATPSLNSAGDVNGDGRLDFVVNVNSDVVIFLGNGNGTFAESASYASGILSSLADFNGDGHLDIGSTNSDSGFSIRLGNGNGTFGAENGYSAGGGIVLLPSPNFADLNGDGKLDVILYGYQFLGVPTSNMRVLLNNGDGTFALGATLSSGPGSGFVLGDFDRNGTIDLIEGGGSGYSVRLGNGDGTFQAKVTSAVATGVTIRAMADYNSDGILDFAGFLESSLASGTDYGIFLGNGDGTFRATASESTGMNGPFYSSPIDINGDGVPDLVGSGLGDTYFTVVLANSYDSATVPKFNMQTQAEARSALIGIDAALDRVRAERGNIGAAQSRLSTAFNVATAMRDAYQQAASRIVDADVAEETAKLVRQQVLQQAATAVLAQANQQSAIVLRLLKVD